MHQTVPSVFHLLGLKLSIVKQVAQTYSFLHLFLPSQRPPVGRQYNGPGGPAAVVGIQSGDNPVSKERFGPLSAAELQGVGSGWGIAR